MTIYFRQSIMEGNSDNCELKATNRAIRYNDVVAWLESNNFEVIGEGGFGKIYSDGNCLIKLIKNLDRCRELEIEKTIYEQLSGRPPESFPPIEVKIPDFRLFEKLESFCHFNMMKIYPTISKWGRCAVNDGWGYVQHKVGNNYQCFDAESGQIITVPSSDVTVVDRPGQLHHFYINEPDVNMRHKLENYQGILLGLGYLERYYGEANIQKFVTEIGKFVSYIMLAYHIVPTDIEIVIGSSSKSDRTPQVYIYDFNEAGILDSSTVRELEQLSVIFANSMFYKNGKKYFPSLGNKYYSYFRDGFVSVHQDSKSRLLAENILDVYNLKFTKGRV